MCVSFLCACVRNACFAYLYENPPSYIHVNASYGISFSEIARAESTTLDLDLYIYGSNLGCFEFEDSAESEDLLDVSGMFWNEITKFSSSA